MEYYVYAGYDGGIIYGKERIRTEILNEMLPDKVFIGKFNNPVSFINTFINDYSDLEFNIMYILRIAREMFPETKCKKIFVALKTKDGHYILYDKKMDFEYEEGKFEIPNADIIKDLTYSKLWISLMVYRAIPPSFLKDCDLNNVNDMWKMLNDMGFHIAYEDDYSIICQVNADMDEYIEYKIDCYDDFDTVNFYEKAIKFVDKEEFGKELEKCVNERKHVDNPIFI
jgi:hypothetical protein